MQEHEQNLKDSGTKPLLQATEEHTVGPGAAGEAPCLASTSSNGTGKLEGHSGGSEGPSAGQQDTSTSQRPNAFLGSQSTSEGAQDGFVSISLAGRQEEQQQQQDPSSSDAGGLHAQAAAVLPAPAAAAPHQAADDVNTSPRLCRQVHGLYKFLFPWVQPKGAEAG